MTEERFPDLHLRVEKIIQMLTEIGHPKDPLEVPEWLKRVKLLQTFLSVFWQRDPSGKLMVASLNYLYCIIASDQATVGPAVWSILNLVEEEKISEFVEGILSHPDKSNNLKINNVLTAMIDGLGQCGPYTPRLQDWIFAIVKGLEARKNYSVLIEVSENVIRKLMKLLMIPLYRPLIYPTFKQFLYPVVTPHVFYKIIDDVPKALIILHRDIDNNENMLVCLDFAGLIKNLMIRFPPKSGFEAKYNLISAALAKFSETNFYPNSMRLWDSQENVESSSLMNQDEDVTGNLTPAMPYKGLMNQGNTCFLNSVLQILYMTTRFRKELLEKEIDPSEKPASNLQQLFAFMRESNRSVLVPNGVIDSTLPPRFRRGHQQDSSEYLIHLLDILHESERKINGRRQNRYKNSDKRREGNGDFEEENDTIVERLFGGVTKSTIICSFCEKSFPKNEHFRNLYLPVPDDHESYGLQELIDMSLESEELCNDNMYVCANCGAKRNATRRHAVVKAPEHLILTLKLFRFDSVKKQRLKLHSKLKNVNSVELPVYNSNQLQADLVMYDLKGVVLHSGSSLDGGHYFSSAVDPTGQWYTFNDSIVSLAKYEYKWNGGGTPYVLVLRQSSICDPPESPLPINLQILVNKNVWAMRGPLCHLDLRNFLILPNVLPFGNAGLPSEEYHEIFEALNKPYLFHWLANCNGTGNILQFLPSLSLVSLFLQVTVTVSNKQAFYYTDFVFNQDKPFLCGLLSTKYLIAVECCMINENTFCRRLEINLANETEARRHSTVKDCIQLPLIKSNVQIF